MRHYRSLILLVIGLSAQPAAAQPAVTAFGSGCPDSNGRIPVLTTSQLPAIGNPSFTFNLSMASPLMPSYVYGALARAIPPIPLASGSGCEVHLDLASAALLINAGISPLGPITTAFNGTAVHPFPIPPLPPLAGYSVFVQAVVLDPALTLGFVVSNGLQVTFG
jgi:hypothetical protein